MPAASMSTGTEGSVPMTTLPSAMPDIEMTNLVRRGLRGENAV